MSPIGSGLETQAEKLTALLYGKEGSSKTTSALMMANLGRVIAIDSEGGMKPTPLRARGVNVGNIEVWPPEGDVGRISFEALEEEVFIPAKKELEEDPDAIFGFVIDSFSELYQRLTAGAADVSRAEAAAKGKVRGRFHTDIADYGTSTSMMRAILRRFRDLNTHLVITALERRDEDDDGYVQYGPALGPAAANDTMGLVDVVCWTQAEELGPRALPFFTGTTRAKDRHRAKDRFNVLPARMIEPTVPRLLGYLDGTLTRKNDARHQAAVKAMQDE